MKRKRSTQKSLVIIGKGETAEIAKVYFTRDFSSQYYIEGFAVHEEYHKHSNETFLGLPLFKCENLEEIHPPDESLLFVAVGSGKLNRERARVYSEFKQKGYSFVSYVSPKALLDPTAEIGENCFIFEGNVVQYKTRIGNNTTLWAGNHIGHRTEIGNHCFISSHVVLSGYCKVEDYCFLGVGSLVGDNVTIQKDCVLGAGACVTHDTEPGKIYTNPKAKPKDVMSREFFGVPSDWQ